MKPLRFLFAWELGGGLGHTVPLLRVGAKLVSLGHEVHFALRDVTNVAAAQEIVGIDFKPYLWQAPHWDGDLTHEIPEPATHIEMALHAGWHDPRIVRSLLEAWEHIIWTTGADVVLCDAAPTALVAAGQAMRPRAQIGNGFTLPSVSVDCFRPDAPPGRLVQSRERFCATMDALRLHEHPSVIQNLLVTVPELDHFEERAKATNVLPPTEYLGLITRKREGEIPDPLYDFGLYLKADAPWSAIMNETLRHVNRIARYVPSIDAEPFDPAEVGIVVCHGGAGLVAEALQAGRPVVILPQTYEQWMLGQRVHALGAGILVAGHFQAESLRCALREIQEPRYKLAALAFAKKYPWEDVAAKVAGMLVELVQ